MATAGKQHTVCQRILAPAVKRLHTVMSCGMTPRKLALTLCLGTALGIMPLLWGTSLLCLLLAHRFRLNHLALQSVNYLLYPLQLALLVPFFKLGDWLLPWGTPVTPDMFSRLLHNPGASIGILSGIVVKSVAAWMLTAIPVALLSYAVLRLTLPQSAGKLGENCPALPEC